MSPQLTVHNAQVSTATVEIKTLTISGKQVTLAVFRQLREEQPADESLRGAWGRVNHCPDSSCKRSARNTALMGPWPPHEHVVWQKGDELRRATIWYLRPTSDKWTGERQPPGRSADRASWQQIQQLPQLFIAV